MDWIFRPIIDKWEPLGTKVGKYMDDMAVATCTNLQDHITCVTEILELAMQYDLFFTLEKCIFHAPCMDYLGIIIEKGMTCMDPVKVEGIQNWPRLSKVKDIRSFLGFCNFYRPFIKGFAHITRPLNELTKKDAEWNWTSRQEEAFNKLKECVTFEWNVLLDLSGGAATKMFSSLKTELLLQVLGKSTWTVTIGMIH